MVPKPAIRSIFTDHFDHSLRNKSKAKKLQVFDKEDTNPAREIVDIGATAFFAHLERYKSRSVLCKKSCNFTDSYFNLSVDSLNISLQNKIDFYLKHKYSHIAMIFQLQLGTYITGCSFR